MLKPIRLLIFISCFSQAEAQDAERTLFEEIERVRAENVELRQARPVLCMSRSTDGRRILSVDCPELVFDGTGGPASIFTPVRCLPQDVLLSKEEAARLRTAMHAAEKQLESRANDVLPATQHTGPRAESADNHAQDAASRMRLERQRAELTTSLSVRTCTAQQRSRLCDRLHQA